MTEERPLLRRVVIGIAAFKSDRQVMNLLAKIFERGGTSSFAAVVVVDSLSDGSLAQDIAQAGWPVIYENADVNLGAAGNLDRRLALAAEQDADWCFAINHDGMFDEQLIETLVRKGRALPKAGAVFPKRILIDRGNSSFRPITSIFGTARHADAGEADEGDHEVAWESSNGALYALAPIREGTPVWTELWHGWEDLAYSWQLGHDGWKQYRCSDAHYLDDYEYHRVSLLGRAFFIARKPPWYAYYLIRNLVLIVRRTKAGARGWWFIAQRLIREIGFTLLFRTEKGRRFAMLGKGLFDGLAGRTGKGPAP